jgi:hypothetical protein
MKKSVNFLGYAALILVGLLGAYIVVHMWQLSERFRSPYRSDTHQSERVAADETPSVTGAQSEEAKTAQSPSED